MFSKKPTLKDTKFSLLNSLLIYSDLVFNEFSFSWFNLFAKLSCLGIIIIIKWNSDI